MQKLQQIGTIAIRKSVSLLHTRNFRQVHEVAEMFEWHDCIGTGSHGQVFRATNRKWQKECAIKIISKVNLLESPILMKLMSQELHVCEQLEHPHIVRVLDLFEDTFQIYIVMEYLTGGHLLDLLTRLLSDNSQRLSEKDIGNIIYQVMLALNHMHQRGIVHRDLKLENIMTQ